MATDYTPPTYGNWRRPSSPGVAGLGLAGTLVLFAGAIIVVTTMMFSILAAIGMAVLVALGLAPLLVHDRHGRNGLQRITARIAWARGHAAGQHLYRSGPTGKVPTRRFELPGLAAPIRPHLSHDSYGQPFALLHHPATNHYTVVLDVEADGAALVDPQQVDLWISNWGAWLGSLGYENSLVATSVTVETSPDTGMALRQEVLGNLSPNAPALAEKVMRQAMVAYPHGSATISTRIALTYTAARPGGGKARTADEMAVAIGERLPGLYSSLSDCGAGAGRPMPLEELSAAIRVAYDPRSYQLVAEALAQGAVVPWADAGPTGAQEYPEHYEHDGAVSVSWSMADAPPGIVHGDVLTKFLAPHQDIDRKRVTLLYRPHAPAEAARLVERDRRDAYFKTGDKIVTARNSVEVRAAEQSAREQATGAGVVRFGMVATATVLDREDLARASAAMDNLSVPARIAMRKVRYGQSAAFTACLPLGLVLPQHLRVPTIVRDNM